MSVQDAVIAAARMLARVISLFLPSWLAGPSTPESHGGSRWARRGDLQRLQRGGPANAAPDGIVVGWLRRQLLQTPAEDNLLLLGVQRSGKTSTIAVPTLLTWGGAAVATSTKEELVHLTLKARRAVGPVWVFAPLDEDGTWCRRLGLERATWNPITAVSTPGHAAELADHFTREGKRGGSAHWYLSASSLLTGLILFTAERGGDMRSVLAVLNRTAIAEYVGLAAAATDRTASELLLAFALTPEREAGSIASTARSCLSLWVDERVSQATAESGVGIDLDRLLAESGTLYLVAPSEEAERCRPLFSALLQALLRKATARARRQGGVMSPRLLLALDEAANFARIPRLSGYGSSGPGQGIQLLLCYHDLAQLESAYGPEEARTIWNNCRARLLLPGQGDLRTLEQFSRAIGDETRIYRSQNHDDRHSSQSEQRVGRPLAAVDELRPPNRTARPRHHAAHMRRPLRRSPGERRSS